MKWIPRHRVSRIGRGVGDRRRLIGAHGGLRAPLGRGAVHPRMGVPRVGAPLVGVPLVGAVAVQVAVRVAAAARVHVHGRAATGRRGRRGRCHRTVLHKHTSRQQYTAIDRTDEFKHTYMR